MLLSGDYAGLVDGLAAMRVHQFVLEYATPRAGDVGVVGPALAGREIGLGVVNPRTTEAEDPAEIVARVGRAQEWFPPERIMLNPDCGFGCFANRCVNDEHTARAKLESLVEAARRLRETAGGAHGPST